MNKIFLHILLILYSLSTLNAQQINKPKGYMFSGNWVFTVAGGGTYSFTDYKESAFGLSLRGSGEYFFDASGNNIFSLKLFVASDKVSAEDDRSLISSVDSSGRYIYPKINTDIISVGIGINYNYSINKVAFPFIGIGISNMWFDPKDDNGNPAAGNAGELYKKTDQSFFVEGGIKFIVSRNLSINLSANMQIALNDYLDDVAAGKSNDAYLSGLIGLSYAPFMKSEVVTKPKEEPTGVREETKIKPDTVSIKTDTSKTVIKPVEITPIITPLTTPDRITLNADDIFNSNSAQIKFDAKNVLDSVITLIRLSPEANWRIEGHMDSQGTERLIRSLSFERARAILEYFGAFGGLDKGKFEIFGMGDKFPVGNNNTEEGRTANRRIELIMVK